MGRLRVAAACRALKAAAGRSLIFYRKLGVTSLACTISAHWRAMCMRSSASVSSISFPLTSIVTLWMVPVNLNGLG
jgi:hypothetical protein